ncbi:hypothetical protein [Shewanella surugensis]|uniref:Uncharacterized protein n=1 Tax=Shewanella surugensis TaxID=212020 RepID=A0ABT0LG14_9GAMM|nr:hypothetical protein [Shewanella surugensis]MCL1126629.1 hypothetical protein [Shewanella surugensis]
MKRKSIFWYAIGYVFFSILLLTACSDDNDNEDIYDRFFVEPETRVSSDGILSTTLTAAFTENTITYVETGELITVNTPNYEGSLVGPTLISILVIFYPLK